MLLSFLASTFENKKGDIKVKKSIILLFIALLLSGCSSNGFKSLGSLAGVIIATKKGENVLVGSLVGGLAGQAIGSQVVGN